MTDRPFGLGPLNQGSDLSDPRVAVVRSAAPYPERDADGLVPRIADLGDLLGWSDPSTGAFGRVLPAGARVVVKPNFVTHENEAPCGLEPLITHLAVIQAVVVEALKAPIRELLVGDAPLQYCDFDALRRLTGMDTWEANVRARDPRFLGVFDFRRTRSRHVDGMLQSDADQISIEEFVLYDLGHESRLEPVTQDGSSFRVTCYPPDLMRRTHGPGKHQYLVARALIDADVVINVPKLKTHRKAGVTCALKNLVGINGNKEFLPHHRVGGSTDGGDCYPGRSALKRSLEFSLDLENSTASHGTRKAIHQLNRALFRLVRMQGDQIGVDGGWSGNDTVWRMCLDLNRILLYGQSDGTLREQPQRRVLHVVDGVVAGHGNGPLAPEPFPLGLLLASESAPAMDLVAARLLQYDIDKVHLVRESFLLDRRPLCSFPPERVELTGALGDGVASALLDAWVPPIPVLHPPGWRDAAATSRQVTSERTVGRLQVAADG
jgi:uncharacterized protein (DUF362 family)